MWGCGKEAKYRWDTQSDCTAKILWRYKNLVLYSPDPPLLFGGASGNKIKFSVNHAYSL